MTIEGDKVDLQSQKAKVGEGFDMVEELMNTRIVRAVTGFFGGLATGKAIADTKPIIPNLEVEERGIAPRESKQ